MEGREAMTAHSRIEEKPFTVATLADRWQCSEGAIRNMLDRGELQSFRIGALIRIRADEVERIECQNTPCSDSGAVSQSSGEKTESAAEQPSTPKIGRARKPRPAASGRTATIHHGPWEG
tara:strand:- start:397 stop:756 length:360 start_codon:yes stop_codon:yes gene_type:complete